MNRSELIKQMLPIYEKCNKVGEVIFIDNDTSRSIDLSEFKKVRYYPQVKNIYVNPAWNLGVSLAKYKIILANDDILIQDLSELLELFDKTEYTLVGANLHSSVKEITPLKRFPANSFGCFMYVKNYIYIPDQIKVWRGDMLLYDNSVVGWVGGFIKSPKSVTIDSIGCKDICMNDIKEYDNYRLRKDVTLNPYKKQNELNYLFPLNVTWLFESSKEVVRYETREQFKEHANFLYKMYGN